MTDSKLIIKQCQRCGASLVQRGNELYCEYCRTSYQLPKNYSDQNEKGEAENRHVPPSFSRLTPPPPIVQYTDLPTAQPKKRARSIWIIAIIVVSGLCGLFAMISSQQKETKVSDPNSETELAMYRRNSSAMPDEYPSAFIHGTDLSLGAILDSLSPNEFGVDIYAKNLLDRTIEANKKTDQFIISEVEVSDSLGNSYNCEIWNEFEDAYDSMDPGGIALIGRLVCAPGTLPPETKSITVHAYFTNWGDYIFQISTDLDINELQYDYSLIQYENSFKISTSIYAVIPQFIAIKYSDISLIDDKGNYYAFDHCDSNNSGFNSSSDEFDLFMDLAERYSPGSYIDCYYDVPIPYEVNSMTFVINIRGNVVTHLFTTDTIN